MIESYSFGSMTVAGLRCDKDLKIIRGEVVPRWWRKEGHLLKEADLLTAGPSSPRLAWPTQRQKQYPEISFIRENIPRYGKGHLLVCYTDKR